MQWPRIKAQAIVDVGAFDPPIELYAFLVTCWGELHQGGEKLPRRRYEIAAACEDDAAHEGLDRYVAEMERIN